MARVSALRSPAVVTVLAAFFLVLLASAWWAGLARGQEGGATALENGQWLSVSLTEAGTQEFYLDLPADRTSLTVELEVNQGALSLAANGVSCPDLAGDGSRYGCSMASPGPGRWTFTVTADLAGEGRIKATYAPTPEAGAVALTNALAEDFSLVVNEPRYFFLDLPSGRDNLTVNLTGSGMDLYLGLGQAPTTADPPCGTPCTVDNPLAGKWYVLVKAGEAGPGSLTGAYTPEGSETAQELSPGQETPVVGGGVYYIDVPGGQGSLLIGLVQEGDLNLFSKYGAPPDPGQADYDCTAPAGQTQECLHQTPSPGRWYILIDGPADQAGSLTASLTQAGEDVSDESPGDGGLPNNRWVTLGNLTPCGEGEMFTIEVPEGVALFKVDLITYQSDVALFVRQGAAPVVDDADLCSEDGDIEANKKPDIPPGQDKDKDKGDNGKGNDKDEDDGPAEITGEWDCMSYDQKNTEKCSFHWPQGGTWYILVKAYGPSSSVKFKPLYSGNPADEDAE